MFKFRSVRSSRSARKTSRNTALQTRPCSHRASLEALEQRAVLAAVSWINPAGGAWDVASNWSSGAVPTSADDVTIDTAAAITISIQSSDSISVNSLTTGANDTLSIGGGPLSENGGSLTVAAPSVLDGPLSIDVGTLKASGPAASLTANGNTTVSGAGLYAEGGGVLSLPKLTSYASSPYAGVTLEANGAGSVLDLSALTSLTQEGRLRAAGVSVTALQGGRIDLGGLSSLSATQENSLTLEVNDSGSVIDLSNLTSLNQVDDGSGTIGQWNLGAGNGGEIDLHSLRSLSWSQGAYLPGNTPIYLSDTGGSQILDDQLASLNGVNITLDGTDQQVARAWSSLTWGSLTVSAGSYDLPGLTDVDDSSLYAKSGGILTLPNVTAFAPSANLIAGSTIQADGAGSVLNLPALKSVSVPDQSLETLAIKATNGGQVGMAGLTSLRGAYTMLQIVDTGGGTIIDPNLANLDTVEVTLDGTDAQVANAWTNFTIGVLKITGGSYDLSDLSTFDGLNMIVSNGGRLTLPNVTRDTTGGILSADGAGSVLDLSNLAGLISASVRATNGGLINLGAATGLANTLDPNAPSSQPHFEDTGGSTILDNHLTSLSGVTATLDGTDPLVANSWNKFTGGQLNISGGSCDLAALTDFDGSSLDLSNGGSLALPGLTQFNSGRDVYNGSTFQVDSGSVLDLSSLTTVTQAGWWTFNFAGEVILNGLTALNPSLGIVIDDGGKLVDANLTSLDNVSMRLSGADVQAAANWKQFTNGSLYVTGDVNLPGLTDVDGSSLLAKDGAVLSLPGVVSYAVTSNSGPLGPGLFYASGAGSVLNLSALKNVTEQGGMWTINATDGGTIKLSGLTSLSSAATNPLSIAFKGNGTIVDDNLTSLDGVNVTLDGSNTQAAQPWGSFTNGTLYVTGGSYRLPGLADLDGSSLYVENSASLRLSSLSRYTSNGASFVASGAGSVLDVSDLDNAWPSGGWSLRAAAGGAIELQGITSVTSDQAIGLASVGAGSAIELPNLATFIDANSSVTVGDGGSISLGAQTLAMPSAGSGLSITVPQLAFDVPVNLSSTGTFNGATFNIGQGDRVNIADGAFDGNTTVNVAKQATLDLTGGNLVDYSGKLAASGPGTVQLSSGGVVVGASDLTLDFPAGEFQWMGGEFYASSNAVTNAGSLEIGPGQKLTDTGSLINRGALSIGAGGQLTVGGDFTQTPGGALTFGISGVPASGQFGQLAVTNAAALDGSIGVDVTGGFVPQDNEAFPVMTFASESGNFSNLGLGLSFQERLQPTSLNLVTSLHDTIDSPLGATLHATEGTTFSGAVASFSDSIPLAKASDFTATIDWGDGTTTTGSVAADNAGGFSIAGAHVYSEEGTKTLTISVNSLGGGSATMQSQAIVGEAAVIGSGATLTVEQGVSLTNAVVATFTHGDGAEPPTEFAANIDWGDGQTSAGAVVESNGTYSVSGSHVYAQSGAFATKTTITDDGISTVIDGSATISSLSTPYQKYVAAVYEDVLGRAPDSGGLAYWVEQLTGGVSISSLAASIAHSGEYYANFVIKPDYLKLLDRAADDGAVTYWTAKMQAGLTDQQFEAGLIASDEFYQAAENFDAAPDADDTSIADSDHNADWVDAVYKLLLGRTADSGGEAYWTQQLAAGVSRGEVALAIAGGAENNTQLINADYFHYLGRAADPDGLNYWLEQFAAGKTNEDVIAGFTGSLEYYEKHTS